MKVLENKVAIVTGGGGGLGRAIAHSLAADGARVLVAGRDAGKLKETVELVGSVGGLAVACARDLLEPGGPRAAVDEALESFGGIDILVNCAGVFVWKKFLDQARDDWDRTIATNLSLPFFMTQEVARVLVEQERGGAILNIASIHGRLGDPNVVPHCASKFGLIGLTEATAEALRPHNIRVNAIAPGQIAPDSTHTRGESPQELVTQADLATLAVFLVSDLTRTITGTVVDANGSTRRLIKA